MSANRIPIYHDSKAVAQVQISTANTNRDGTGTLGTVLTASSTGNGVAVTVVTYIAAVTTTAGMVRLFLDDGSNKRLIAEIAVAAVTPSATVACATGTYTPPWADGLVIPPGWSLKASTHNAEAINVFAHYGTY